MNNHGKLKAIANTLISTLRGNGFVIQRYDALSTDSIYLKLDFGVANSIRISDHNGKKHLQYRYNVILGCANNIVEETYMRYFFNEDSLEALVLQVLFDRKMKVNKYGKLSYRNFMIKNMNEKGNSKGFWNDAKLINDEWRLDETDVPETFVIDSDRHNEVISDATVVKPKQDKDILEKIFETSIRENPNGYMDRAARFHVGDNVKAVVDADILTDYFMSYGYPEHKAKENAKLIILNNHMTVTKFSRFESYDEDIYYALRIGANLMQYLPEVFLQEDYSAW